MQILVIALIILLLFGASRVGEAGRGFADGARKKGPAFDPKSKAVADGDETAPSSSASALSAALAEAQQAAAGGSASTETDAASAASQASRDADKTPLKPDPSAS